MARRRVRYAGNTINTDPIIRLLLLSILVVLGLSRIQLSVIVVT